MSRYGALGLVLLLLVLAPASAAAAEEKPQTQPSKQEGESGGHHDHSHDATTTHRFSDVERWEQVFDDPSRAEWQKPAEIPAVLGLTEGMAIADIGAGTGYFERFFSRAVGGKGKVYAVDVEPAMVQHLSKRALKEGTANVLPTLATAEDPGLPEGSVDVVFICDTYHHIGDRIDYIHRLGRALKPGGTVAVVDYYKKPLPVGPGMKHKLSERQVIDEFAEAGWDLARQSDILPYQYFLIFKPREER